MSMTKHKIDMNPTPFEPHRNNRWSMHIDDMHPFLVKDVSLPKIKYRMGSIEYEDLIVTLYNTMDDDVNSWALNWMKNAMFERDATLKFVDQAGNVVESWSLRVQPFTIEFDKLSYENASPFLTTMTFRCSNVEIECSPS